MQVVKTQEFSGGTLAESVCGGLGPVYGTRLV